MTEIYYQKSRIDKNKETLVFLHGLTGNITRWSSYYDNLKDKYSIFLFDLIGHGKSYRPTKFNAYSFDNNAGNILDILEKEQIDKINIISHSFSAKTALKIYEKNPEIVNSLVFISPFIDFKNKKHSKKVRCFIKIYKRLWNYLPEKQDFTHKQTKERDKLLFHDYKKSIEIMGKKSYVANTYFLLNEKPSIKEINCPVLVVYGEKDILTNEQDTNYLKSTCRNIKFKTMPGKSHFFIQRNYREICKEIEEFLGRRFSFGSNKNK